MMVIESALPAPSSAWPRLRCHRGLRPLPDGIDLAALREGLTSLGVGTTGAGGAPARSSPRCGSRWRRRRGRALAGAARGPARPAEALRTCEGGPCRSSRPRDGARSTRPGASKHPGPRRRGPAHRGAASSPRWPARPARGRPRCSTSSARSTSRRAGRVRLDGRDLVALCARGALADLRLRPIGFVFQAYNLIPVLTALENAEFVLLLQGAAPPSAARACAEVLERDGPRRAGGPAAAPSFRRAAAARGGGARDRGAAGVGAGRRADRQPRLGDRRRAARHHAASSTASTASPSSSPPTIRGSWSAPAASSASSTAAWKRRGR